MLPTTVNVFAPAKINLTLHITGQREDGFHILDSLVAFATVGDRLKIGHAEASAFSVGGPEAGGVPLDASNLALRAAALADRDERVALALEKNLPPASGIGGGSADAAAAYRGIRALYGYPSASKSARSEGSFEPNPEVEQFLDLGADVPMCLLSHPARARGIGERLELVTLPPIPAVLVNPRVPVSTPDVFARLEQRDNPPMPDALPEFESVAALIIWLKGQRNDLEAPARQVAPEVEDVLRALEATAGCDLARMSGSGATCFGLYADAGEAETAAEALTRAYPDWWIASCILSDQSDAATPQIS